MPKFYVGLDQSVKFNYSPIGDRLHGEFIYVGEFGRRVWLGEVTDKPERLAELVNGATAMVRFMNFVDLPMKVFTVVSNERDPLLAAAEEIEAEKKDKAEKEAEHQSEPEIVLIAPLNEPIAPIEPVIAPLSEDKPKVKRTLKKKAHEPAAEAQPRDQNVE